MSPQHFQGAAHAVRAAHLDSLADFRGSVYAYQTFWKLHDTPTKWQRVQAWIAQWWRR